MALLLILLGGCLIVAGLATVSVGAAMVTAGGFSIIAGAAVAWAADRQAQVEARRVLSEQNSP